jgi:hypothetical protein
MDSPSHRLVLPQHRSGRPTGPRSSCPLHQAYTFSAEELSRRRCTGDLPPHCHPTSWVHSRGPYPYQAVVPWAMMVPVETSPSPVPAHAVLRTLRTVWAASWAVHRRCHGPHRVRLCPVATRLRRPHTLCMWAGRTSFGPRTVF